MEKRTFLKLLVTGGSLVTAAILAIPAIGALLSPVVRRKREPRWRPIGRRDEFPLHEVKRAIVEIAPERAWNSPLHSKAVYVWRPAESELVVYSRHCTDLSCPVRWDSGSHRFFCPCHGGIFAQDGTPLAGPPKRPLDRYATRVRDGMVEIDLNSLPPIS